jgi:hypothetical protein
MFQMSLPPGVFSSSALSMLVFDPTVRVSTTGDSPLTVTASLKVPTFIGASMLIVCPCRRTTSSRT